MATHTEHKMITGTSAFVPALAARSGRVGVSIVSEMGGQYSLGDQFGVPIGGVVTLMDWEGPINVYGPSGTRIWVREWF